VTERNEQSQFPDADHPGVAPGAPNQWAVPVNPAAFAPRQTNGLAVASLVLGILWLFWIGSILAVIFGHVALNQIKAQEGPSRPEGKGLAIAGLVLGYVGVGTLTAWFFLFLLAVVAGSGGG
jgi:hypothetical protein